MSIVKGPHVWVGFEREPFGLGGEHGLAVNLHQVRLRVLVVVGIEYVVIRFVARNQAARILCS